MAFTDYDKCALLLPMDGSNGGTTFTDWSIYANSLTRAGATLPVTSTAQFKFYDSSGLFGANTAGNQPSKLQLSKLLAGSGAFTIALWARVANTSDIHYLLDTRANSAFSAATSSDNAFIFYLRGSDSGKLAFTYGSGNTRLDCSTSFTADLWHHCAVTRDDSNTLRIFFNGTKEYEGTVSNNFSNIYSFIGGTYTTVTAFAAKNLCDLMCVTGAALWTADFTPPARLIGEISGTVYDSTGTEAARTITAAPRSYPTKVFTTTSSGVDGTYSLRVPATEVTRVAFADDVAEGATYNDIIDRIIPE